ncbi:hypothetical protein N2152v2_008658 [Parachlorella kessleri]
MAAGIGGWLPVAPSGRGSVPATQRTAARSLAETSGRVETGPSLTAADTQASPLGRNIVVAAALDLESVEAFQWALQHLYRQGDTLTVLHVVPDSDAGPTSGSIYYCPPCHDPESERCLWSQAREFLEENFVEAGKQQGIEVQVVMAHERHKGVGRALCKKAAELRATMVVLGGHKKSKVEEMLMGSTSKYVAYHCTQPVLVLH